MGATRAACTCRVNKATSGSILACWTATPPRVKDTCHCDDNDDDDDDDVESEIQLVVVVTTTTAALLFVSFNTVWRVVRANSAIPMLSCENADAVRNRRGRTRAQCTAHRPGIVVAATTTGAAVVVVVVVVAHVVLVFVCDNTGLIDDDNGDNDNGDNVALQLLGCLFQQPPLSPLLLLLLLLLLLPNVVVVL
jgi:hypothetical protein